jgi:hypothetical protein
MEREERTPTHAREVFDGILWHRMYLELREQEPADSRI